MKTMASKADGWWLERCNSSEEEAASWHSLENTALDSDTWAALLTEKPMAAAA
jgi:hypothetical protein